TNMHTPISLHDALPIYGQRIGRFEGNVRAFNFRGCFMTCRPVGPREGLRAQGAGSIVGEVHERAGMIDRNRPVVAGYVPIEFVVAVEVTNAVAHRVADLDGLSRVNRIGNIDLHIPVTAGSVRLVLQLVAIAVGDGNKLKYE